MSKLTVKEFVEKFKGKKFIHEDEGECVLIGFDKGDAYKAFDEEYLLYVVELLEEDEDHTCDGYSKTFVYTPSNAENLFWSEYKDLTMIEEDTPSKGETVLNNQTIIDDYKRRFKDIFDIVITENKTIVVLKSKVVGSVTPCEEEVVDTRVGVLEAYVKALKIEDVQVDFMRNHSDVTTVKLSEKKCVVQINGFEGEYTFDATCSLSTYEKMKEALYLARKVRKEATEENQLRVINPSGGLSIANFDSYYTNKGTLL